MTRGGPRTTSPPPTRPSGRPRPRARRCTRASRSSRPASPARSLRPRSSRRYSGSRRCSSRSRPPTRSCTPPTSTCGSAGCARACGPGSSCGGCWPPGRTGWLQRPVPEVTRAMAEAPQPSPEDAYTAYSYLTPGVDFRSFELVSEFGRVPPYVADLTAEEQQRAQRLLADSLVISLHDHPSLFPVRMEETPDYYRTGRQHTGYAGLAASGMTVVFDNMMDGTACVTGHAPWRWEDIITDLGMRQADLAHQTGVMTVRTVADIDEAYRSGRVGLVFGLEAATPIENELDRLDVLYGLGLRQIGIAYSDANALGSGLSEPVDGGLTAFGHRAVTRMNQLGLAVDLSHSSERTALVFITHAGARAVWDIARMKPDDVLRAVAQTGGVIGMSAAPHTTLSQAHPRHTIESVMDHFEYIAGLVGIEHVAFGPDTFWGDHVALHRIFAHLLSIKAARGPAFEPVAYVDGLENPAENFANICGWLVEHGYSDDDTRAVLGGNIYRALQSIWVSA